MARDDHAHGQYPTAETQDAGSTTGDDDDGEEKAQADVHAHYDDERASDEHDRNDLDEHDRSDLDEHVPSDHDDEYSAHDNDDHMQARDDDDAETEEEARQVPNR
jgi:hypothetical protein